MIKLVNPCIETPLYFDCSRPALLIVENPREYYRLVSELNAAMQNEISSFTFWKGDEKLVADKHGEILLNLFDFDFADKKIIGLLYKKLQQNYFDGNFITAFNKLNSDGGSFLQKLFSTVDFALDYEELTLESLFKACSVKPAKVYENLLEKIICYINLFVELKNVSFFIFAGLKEILNDEDLSLLYRHCELVKVGLLIIEGVKQRELLPAERAVIITDDLCEIVENL